MKIIKNEDCISNGKELSLQTNELIIRKLVDYTGRLYICKKCIILSVYF